MSRASRPTDLVDKFQEFPSSWPFRLGKGPVTSAEVRKLFELRGFIYPKKDLAFNALGDLSYQAKLSYLFAVRAYHYGSRVLCLDLDPRESLIKYFQVAVGGRMGQSDAVFEVADRLHAISIARGRSSLAMVTQIRAHYDLMIFNSLQPAPCDLLVYCVEPDSERFARLKNVIVQMKGKAEYAVLWTKAPSSGNKSEENLLETVPDLAERTFPIVIPKESLPDAWGTHKELDWLVKECLGIRAWQNSKSPGHA